MNKYFLKNDYIIQWCINDYAFYTSRKDISNDIGLDHQVLPHKVNELEDAPLNQRSLVGIFVLTYTTT